MAEPDQPDQPGRPPWDALRRHTAARIALGRTGISIATGAHLAFQLAHARARDAVHQALDTGRLHAELTARGLTVECVHGAAADRRIYLQRPDQGRRLDQDSRLRLLQRAPAAHPGTRPDLALVLADGLSAPAVQRHAVPLLDALLARLRGDSWVLAPVVIASQARVALGDEIGAVLGARMVAVLIGERPGLSSPDSLGVYLTWAPQVGTPDARRNCLSNIRPEGLPVEPAAARLAWLLDAARQRQLSGIALKDESPEFPLLSSIAVLPPADSGAVALR